MWAVFAILLVECLFSGLLFNDTTVINENIGLIIVLINSITVFFALYRLAKGDKNILAILVLAFCGRMLLLALDLYGRHIFVLPGSGNDTEMFNGMALTFPNFSFSDNPYSYLIGLIYSLTENGRIVAQYVNLLLGMTTILLVMGIFDEFKINYSVKVLLIGILSFIPNYMILSVILLRESIMIFLLALSLFCFVKWWTHNNLLTFVLSIVFVLLSSLFHSGVIANAVGYILVFIICNNKDRQFKLNYKSSLAAGLFVLTFLVSFNQYSDVFLGKFGSVEDVNDITNRTALAQNGGSSYNVGGEVNSFSDLIINSPIRMFYFITSPLPWSWRGLNDVIAFIFSAMFYFLSYIYAIKALRVSEKGSNRNFIIVGLVLALLGAFLFAWGVSNAGTAMRHRDKFIVNYIVMLGISLNSIKQNVVRRKSNYDLRS